MLWLLCALLVLGRPLGFALELANTLPSIEMRGTLGLLELAFHGGVAAIAMAAARALWIESPAAPRLASVAVIASAIVNVQSLYWSVLPQQVAPGDELWRAALA